MFSIPFNTSSCKDDGPEPFSNMFYEIGEHSVRNLRPFLLTESFQILDILRLPVWTAFFNSNHRFSMGFKSGDFVVN